MMKLTFKIKFLISWNLLLPHRVSKKRTVLCLRRIYQIVSCIQYRKYLKDKFLNKSGHLKVNNDYHFYVGGYRQVYNSQ